MNNLSGVWILKTYKFEHILKYTSQVNLLITLNQN